MKTETFPFDPALYLTDEAAQVELVQDALESGNASYIAVALGTVARARGMARVARETGISREALYKSLSDAGNPRLSTLLGVMKSLGLKLAVMRG